MNGWPTVVLSLFDDIDFVATTRPIESAWSMFSLKHQIRPRLPVHSLRVPMTNGPDLGFRVRLAHERIVLRNSAVVVQAQCLAGESIELLSKVTTRRVASRDVKLSIRPKTNAAARVKSRRRKIFDYDGAIDEPFRCFAITHHTHTHTTTPRVGI